VSPDASSEFVTLARVVKTQGRHGEVAVEVHSDVPDRFGQGMKLYGLDRAGAARRNLEIESLWPHKQWLVLKFRGVDTISDAEKLVGAEVCVPCAERLPLAAGEYYESDLIGCEVVERDGAPLGRVTRFEDAAGSGLLELENGLLIPFARAICVDIDPQARRIVVDLPVGLKELNQA